MSRAFDKIRQGLEDAVDHDEGRKQLTVRDVELAPPAPIKAREIVALRKRLNVSQGALAALLNVSPRTVQAWETEMRTPSDAALKLLRIATKHPEVLWEPA